MGGNRRRFSREFKLEAVRMVAQGDRSLTRVAKDLGIQPSLLSRWRKRLESQEVSGESQDAELRRLRRELDRVRQERDILKKATAYFARLRD